MRNAARQQRWPILALLFVLASPGLNAAPPMPEAWGQTTDGIPVERYTLTNSNGITVRVMSRGATITEWLVPDKAGKPVDIVVGFDDLAGYESDRNRYFGCTIGRVANRIAQGKFSLNGKQYTLGINNGPNASHGGLKRSFDKVVWKARGVETEHGPGVRFTHVSPDGEEGYPGTLSCSVTMTLSQANDLRLEYEATTDADTPVNLTNHSYFNLAGAGSPSVLDHVLEVRASHYTPTDDTLIPTGAIEPVEGTALDFRKPMPIGARIDHFAMTSRRGYDHNYVCDGEPGRLRHVATLTHPSSGRELKVSTTEPAIQVYSGNNLKGQIGKRGQAYFPRSAMCLETQHYPDSVNHPEFPSVILKPGATYRHTCVYSITTK